MAGSSVAVRRCSRYEVGITKLSGFLMANPDHLKLILHDVDEWNQMRSVGSALEPQLSGANLYGANLVLANLARAVLRKANLALANLKGADLRASDLRNANLV